eukprot:11247447-Prorocentrum_lima.AAC.1
MVWHWSSIAVGEIPGKVLQVLKSLEVVALPKPKTSDVSHHGHPSCHITRKPGGDSAGHQGCLPTRQKSRRTQ